MIKNVFIDIDNTLLDFDKCAKSTIKYCAKLYNVPYSDKLFSTFISTNDMLWLEVEKQTISKDQLHAKRFDIIFNKLGISFDGQTFENAFRKTLYTFYEQVDGANELLCYLSKKYSIYAVSNAYHNQQIERLKNANLLQYLKDCFVSEKMGYDKPAKEFFDKCFSLCNAKKDQTVLIGDSLSADIKGGKNYGLLTIWFNKKNAEKSSLPDYTVSNLLEIKKII